MFIPVVMFGQVADDFSDGDFTSNPTWFGDTALFSVNSEGQLQTSGPAAADTALLFTAFSTNFNDTTMWQWYWKMNFDPSNNNNSRVYLCASDSNLSGSGYFIRLGENGSADALLFYKFVGTTETLLATGTGNYSQAPELTVKVTRYPNGTWELASALLGQSFVLEATAVDSAITESTFFGVWCKYTSSNSTRFYFDNILADSVFLDVTPPVVTSVTPVANNQISLQFSEPLNTSTAELTNNYHLSSGLGNPLSANASGQDSSVVMLTFGSTFPQGTSLSLEVSGVVDTAGNLIVPQTLNFVYYEFVDPGYRDLVINEFMADPTPVIGLPEAEFVELYNRSNGYISTDSISISDPSTSVDLPAQIIGPGEYVILCKQSDSLAFSQFGRVISLSSLPTLNNDGDDLRLSKDSFTLDRVVYNLEWYGSSQYSNGGYSLEQINPEAACTGRQNWRASIDEKGGSPGAANSVLDTSEDVTPPTLIAAEAISSDVIQILFSEIVDTTALFNATMSLGLSVAQISIHNGGGSFILNITPSMAPGQVYTLVISGVADCNGNLMSDTVFRIGVGVSPKPFDLVITELYPIPEESSPLPFAEFVEIHNRTDQLISTAGLAIADLTIDSDFPNRLIYPGDYVVVCSATHSNLFSGFGEVIGVPSLPSLNNTGDHIRLFLNLETIDEVKYNDDWFQDPKKADGGWTLERINTMNLCGLDSNWRASEDLMQGTPGRVNSIAVNAPVQSVPTISAMRYMANNLIELVIDQHIDTLVRPAVSLDGQGVVYQFDQTGSAMMLFPTDTLERGAVHKVVLADLASCNGIEVSALHAERYLHGSGDVVINEVLFNPRGSGTDFVELINTTQYDIDLFNWSLGYEDANDSIRHNYFPIKKRTLNGYGYALLHENEQDLINNYPFAESKNFVFTDLPSYPNSAGTVLVYDGALILVDRFDYREDMHLALISDPDGVSLERLDPKRPTDDEGNWHSAGSADNYATPGYQNSQFAENPVGASSVALSNEYISPDSDGYQDYVNINYQFDSPGHVIKVTVYNSAGVLIRTVTTNHLAGLEGTITWDGVTDDGMKAATGIHIILVESFDINNRKTLHKLPIVVAAKL